MTYKQALIGQPYAQRVNNVLEKLEWNCPRCAGDGIKLSGGVCPRCDGKKKLHYIYSPQVGEWVIYKNKIALIVGTYLEAQKLAYGVNNVKIFDKYHDLLLQVDPSGLVPSTRAFTSECTPILDWQTIEEILEKAGYKFSVRRNVNKNSDGIRLCDCIISNANYRVQKIADSRIKAVYDAVIALGKEMK